MWVDALHTPLPRWLFLFTLLQLPKLSAGLEDHFKVLGPQAPVLALVGKDSELPCHLSPSMSAEHMELRWFRNTFSPAGLVHRGGRELTEEQMPEYQGRVALVQDNVTSGCVAVKIHQVRVFDEGVYGCSFRDEQVRREAFIHLKVTALGSDPHISMEVQENGPVRLECTSSGWYPEPQVQWRTPKGEKLPSTSESVSPDEEGLFTVVTSVVLRDSSIQNVSCSIRNILLGQEKEVGMPIPAPSFRVWTFLMGFTASLALVIVGLVFIWKRYRHVTRRGNGTAAPAPLEWESASSYPVDVTLDYRTAHPHLLLYEDLKSFHLEDSRQTLPDGPERFDSWPCVLGRETFDTGKRYWEVEVGDRMDWLLGVCKESVMKKGFTLMSPKSGFWVIKRSEKGYWALTPLWTLLSLSGAPRQIGIFLDYESGIVSFYNANDGAHIYTFPKASFSEPVLPLFCLWSCDKKPLTICPMGAALRAHTEENSPLNP